MVTDDTKVYIEEHYMELWKKVMKKRGGFDKGDKPEAKHKALEAVFAEYTTELAGATADEFGEVLFGITGRKLQEARKKIPKLIVSLQKDELSSLKAQKKQLDKRIKDLENMVFDGKYFRVRPPTTKAKTSDFRVQQVGSKATLISLPQAEANKHAKELDLILAEFARKWQAVEDGRNGEV
jgi:hypothetical protein